MHFADAAPILAGLFPATNTRFRACHRKRAYTTLEETLAVKERRERLTGLTLRVYRCDYADEPDGHWHLSSQELTDEQRTRHLIQAQAYLHEVEAEFEAHEATIRTLKRAVNTLLDTMAQRARRIDRARSIATIAALYVEQREGLHRLLTLWDEGIDAELAREQLRICVRDVALSEAPRTLESYREVATKFLDVVNKAEQARGDNAAFIAECLASLEALERKDVEWIRHQINQRYALPAMPWRAS
jgi:hypothetical protein